MGSLVCNILLSRSVSLNETGGCLKTNKKSVHVHLNAIVSFFTVYVTHFMAGLLYFLRHTDHVLALCRFLCAVQTQPLLGPYLAGRTMVADSTVPHSTHLF
jgi:hypothetical protein